jgi:Tfp pilus assembly ATPase PilU
MVIANDGLLRVFWPNGLSGKTTPGVMVGWRNSETDIFIITILEDTEVCLCPWDAAFSGVTGSPGPER